MIKGGDNVICLLFMVVRWLVFGIELKFKLFERYLLFGFDYWNWIMFLF